MLSGFCVPRVRSVRSRFRGIHIRSFRSDFPLTESPVKRLTAPLSLGIRISRVIFEEDFHVRQRNFAARNG
jgi:hypothetical protein